MLIPLGVAGLTLGIGFITRRRRGSADGIASADRDDIGHGRWDG